MSNDTNPWRHLGVPVDVTSEGVQDMSEPLESPESLIGGTIEVGTATPYGGHHTPVPAPPGLLGMATSALGSMAKFAASGFKTVSREAHDARVDQCAKCKYVQGTRCTVCNCFVDKKAWMPHEDCPIGKWPV